MIYKDNDYELLYLVENNHDEALEILYKKYENLIKSRIYKFKIKQKNYDDFFQEGLMALEKAIRTFKPSYGKSFTNYFDLILQRRFIQILRKEQKHFYNTVYVEEFYQIADDSSIQYKLELDERKAQILDCLSDFEKEVFECRIVQNLKTEETADILNCTTRQVYNAMLRIREKVKSLPD